MCSSDLKTVKLQLVQRQCGTGGAHDIGIGIGEEADDADQRWYGGDKTRCLGETEVAWRAWMEDKTERVRTCVHCRLYIFKTGQTADFDAHPHRSVLEFVADVFPAVGGKGFVAVELREVGQGFRRVCAEAAIVPPAAVGLVAAGFD